eukprot:jgi/Ulvmu1/6044/UM027_0021.1
MLMGAASMSREETGGERGPAERSNHMHRVKLYKLNPAGLWDDKGTGHVALEYLPKPKAPGLVVVSEVDYKILLVHKICAPSKYNRQGENTIIAWQDDDIGTDVALSFQEEAGCNAIWSEIHSTCAQTNQAGASGDGGQTTSTAGPSAGPASGGSSHAETSLRALASSAAGGAASASANDGATESGQAGGAPGQGLGNGAQGQQPGGPQMQQFASAQGGNGHGAGAGGLGSPQGASQALTGLPQRTGSVCIKLPWPEVRTLRDIEKALAEVPLQQRERVAANIYQEGHYLPRLLEVFRECEDREDREALSHLYGIIKCLIMMNDMQLVELMVTDTCFNDVVGCLEYDPDLAPGKAEHRKFLKTTVSFKEVVEIPDAQTRAKIHATFRIAYIRDAVLPRALDDATFAALHTTMIFNYIDILQSLQASPAFFSTLFRKLKEVDIHSEEAALLFSFVQEVCHLTAHPNFANRADIIALFMKENVIDVLSCGLCSRNTKARTKAMEVILMVLQADVVSMRNAALPPPHALLSRLIALLLSNDELGLPEQACEALKCLLDPESMEVNTQKNDFLELFYSSFMERIVRVVAAAGRALAAAEAPPAAEPAPQNADGDGAAAPAAASTAAAGDAAAAAPAAAAAAAVPAAAGEGAVAVPAAVAAAAASAAGTLPEDPPVPPPFVLALIVDLLQYCVTQHHFRMKFHVLRTQIIHKVLALLKSPKKWLAVAALRFFRTCLGLKDDFYNKYIVKNNLFEEPVRAFLANGDNPNLLNSTFLEMMEFIRQADTKMVALHFIDEYWPRVKHITYVRTFKLLKDAADNLRNPGCAPEDASASGPMRALGQRLVRDPRDLGREEEDYFSAAGDDDDAGGGGGPASASAGMLGGVSSVYMSVGSGSGHGPKDLGGGEPGQRGGLGSRPGQGSRWSGGDTLPGLVPYGDDDDDVPVGSHSAEPSRQHARGDSLDNALYKGAAPLFSRAAEPPASQKGSPKASASWFPQHLSKLAAGAGGQQQGQGQQSPQQQAQHAAVDLQDLSQRSDARRDPGEAFQRHHMQAQHAQQHQQMAAQRQLQAQHAQQAQRQLQTHAAALREAAAASVHELIQDNRKRPSWERNAQVPSSGGAAAADSTALGSSCMRAADDGRAAMQMQVGSMSMQKLAALRAMAEAAEAGSSSWQGRSTQHEHLHAVSAGSDHGPLSWPSGSAALTTSLRSQLDPHLLPANHPMRRLMRKQPGAAPHAPPGPAQPSAPPPAATSSPPPLQAGAAPAAEAGGVAAVGGAMQVAAAATAGSAMQAAAASATPESAGDVAAASTAAAAGGAERVPGADAASAPAAERFAGTVAEGVPVIQGSAIPGAGTVGVGVPVVATGVPITDAEALRADSAATAAAAAATGAPVATEEAARSTGEAEGGTTAAPADEDSDVQRTAKRIAENGMQSPTTKAAKVVPDEQAAQ